MIPLNIIIDLVEVVVGINPNTFAAFSGWIVAATSLAFLYWRIKVWDSRLETKLSEVVRGLEKIQNELNNQISEINDVQLNLVTDATKTMAILSEKIGSLQMIIMQMLGGSGKTRR